MAVVGIKDFSDAMDGNVNNGLFYGMKYAGTNTIERFVLIGADGKEASGVAGAVNEADYLVIGAGVYGKADEGDTVAVTNRVEVILDTELAPGTLLYLANSVSGTLGGLTTDVAVGAGDLNQPIGKVTSVPGTGATSNYAVLNFKSGAIVA